LTPIPGSTRALSGGSASGCAQISFTPAGDVLIVTQLNADTIDTFTIGADGVANGPLINETAGIGPFGFTFDRSGRMLLTENFQAREGQGAVTSYTIGSDGRLSPIGAPLRIGETDPCWFVLSPDGRYAYASSFGPIPIVGVRSETSRRGAISSFRVGDDGTLTLLDSQAAKVDVGAADLALSRDGRYLYLLNSIEGTIGGFQVGPDGSLTLIAAVGGIPANPFGPLSSGLAAR
jgi:6-phosphogluconolactonase (cycloisomerase 2 family)